MYKILFLLIVSNFCVQATPHSLGNEDIKKEEKNSLHSSPFLNEYLFFQKELEKNETKNPELIKTIITEIEYNNLDKLSEILFEISKNHLHDLNVKECLYFEELSKKLNSSNTLGTFKCSALEKEWSSLTCETQSDFLEGLKFIHNEAPTPNSPEFFKFLNNINKLAIKSIDIYTLSFIASNLTQLNHLLIASRYKVSIQDYSKDLYPLLDNISSLSFNSCTHISKELILLLTSICPKVSSLDFSGCFNLNDEVLIQLSKMNLDLSELTFYFNQNLGRKGLKSLLKTVPSLKILSLRGCEISEKYYICDIATYCKKLIRLDLAFNFTLKNKAVKKLLKGCQQLEVFDVTGCHHISSARVNSIAHGLPELQKILIGHNNNVNHNNVLELLKCCKKLNYIDAAFCRCIDANFMENLNFNYPNLKYDFI